MDTDNFDDLYLRYSRIFGLGGKDLFLDHSDNYMGGPISIVDRGTGQLIDCYDEEQAEVLLDVIKSFGNLCLKLTEDSQYLAALESRCKHLQQSVKKLKTSLRDSLRDSGCDNVADTGEFEALPIATIKQHKVDEVV